jgi:vesicle transport through interaction with t-SNAREs protein 1
MEVELQSLPQDMKIQLTARVRTFRDELKKFKKDIGNLKNNKLNADRQALLGGATTIDIEKGAMDQRSRLLQGTEKLQDGSRRLEEARRLALETGNGYCLSFNIRNCGY